MSVEYMDALESAVDTAAADPAVRALVFTSAGDDNFSGTSD
jgi:enoyl-CoA hydratase/carnithine racemase